MKKIIATFFLLIFLTNSPVLAQNIVPQKTASQDEIKTNVVSKQIDQRARVLQAYLSRYDSPLQYNAQDFIDAADTYQLDWKLVPAIAGVESTFGKFTPGSDYSPSYNAWGWGVYGDQAMYFKSWREAIFAVSQGLRDNYLNKGLKDPYAINHVYSESPMWGFRVTYFTQDIQAFDQTVAEPAIPTPLSKELPKPVFTSENYPTAKLTLTSASGILASKN